MQIYSDGNLLHLLEIYHLNDRHRIIVVRGTITAGICHIHVVVDYFHFFRLVTYRDFGRYR